MSVISQPSSDPIRAAYGLALRMTGTGAIAENVVARAARAAGLEPTPLFRAVRAAARTAGGRTERASVPRPDGFHEVASSDWAVVERIALRGMTISEVAAETGLSRADVIARLQRGMRAARACLEGREAATDAEPSLAGALGGDRAAGRFDDAARHRQAEATPLPCLPA